MLMYFYTQQRELAAESAISVVSTDETAEMEEDDIFVIDQGEVNNTEQGEKEEEEVYRSVQSGSDLSDDSIQDSLLSSNKCQELFTHFWLTTATKYDICKEGCVRFKEGETMCPNNACRAPWYMESSEGIQATVMQMKIMSVADTIAVKLRDTKTREKLLYRHNYNSQSSEYNDIFDGQVYKSLKDKHFKGQYDVALGLYIDGFKPFKRGTLNGTLVQLGLDEMHLFGHGHGKLVYNIMNGDFDDQQSIFKLGNGVTMAMVGQAMVNSRSNVPSSFSGNWTDIKKHHSYFRAVDWLDFLLYVFLTLSTTKPGKHANILPLVSYSHQSGALKKMTLLLFPNLLTLGMTFSKIKSIINRYLLASSQSLNIISNTFAI
ncbi:hypothetical protein BC941DRAFT_518632 [Chlamydoabsidia padenii]|nr:hypothetical protein BC941DRAFT_518632 [Chlamydoabsidia padenii]